MDSTYWRKQTAATPLFPDIAWAKPELKSQAGKLGIIGGNKLGFAGVATSYETAHRAGIGQVRVLLPDCLKSTIPSTMTDVVYGACTPSGSLSKDATHELQALGDWSDVVLLIGDAGRNSETAIAYEQFVATYSGPLAITRDAIDLVKNSPSLLVERADTLLIASFAQVRKLFQGVYYPKMLVFSMQLTAAVEALHKFTITYPVTIATLHADTLIVARDGQVTTTKWDNPMAIWRGTTATNAACYWLWNPDVPLESTTASLLDV